MLRATRINTSSRPSLKRQFCFGAEPLPLGASARLFQTLPSNVPVQVSAVTEMIRKGDAAFFIGLKKNGELINEDKSLINGEESAKPSIKGHYPTKDGLLAVLLTAEAVASRGAGVNEQSNEIYKRADGLGSEI